MKKLISLLTLLCMMIPLCIPVVGAIAPQEENSAAVEVLNYSNYISEANVEALKDQVCATFTTASGEVIPLDCTVTIEDVNNGPSAYSMAGSRSYAITVSAEQKIKSNSESDNNRNGVTATAYLTMYWTDNPGPKNTIDFLSGSIDVTKGTIENAKVWAKESHNRPIVNPLTYEIGTSTRFSFVVHYTTGALDGGVHACYSTWFKEWNGPSTLTVCVSPTVWD